MSGRIAVAGGTPVWRRGICSVLTDSGYTATELPGISAWRPGRGGRAVVVSLVGSPSWEELSAFTELYPHIPVVGVVSELSASSLAEVVRAGATTAVDDDAALEALVLALSASLDGRAMVPAAVLQAMSARIPQPPDPSGWIQPDEARWLRGLARGQSVADIAESIGYSEREMFRMLREVYIRIGVANRTEAIIWATRHGVLDPDAGSPSAADG